MRVVCEDLKMIYASSREAEQALEVDHSNIIKCCNGKRKTAGTLRFNYFDPSIHFNESYSLYY